jgi:TolB protein
MVLVMLNFHCVTDKPVEPIEVTYTAEGLVTCTQTGEPIDSVLVRAVSLTLPDDEFPFTYTDSQGIYSLYLGEGSGIDIIQFEKEGFRTEYRTIIIDNIPQKNSTILIDVQLTPHDGPAALYIEGVVTHSVTGMPIDSVLVQMVWESMTEDRWLSTYTDPQGYYSLHFSRREDFDFIIYMKDGYCLAYHLKEDISNKLKERVDIQLVPFDVPTLICPADFRVKDYEPAWSPDGKLIAYVHGDKEPGKSGIYLIEPGGKNNRLWYAGPLVGSPRWSPDGEWIVFHNNGNIYKRKLTGGSAVQLTNQGENFFPDWSPDGKWIVYDRVLADHSGPAGIWIMKNNGTEKQSIFGGAFPTWHPNGKSILAVIGVSPTSGWTIFVTYYPFQSISPDTLDVVKENANYYPRYSTDGTQITFTSQPDGDFPQIWVMNSDGTNARQLTTTQGYTSDWSPDGEWIVYTDTRAVSGRLWIMRKDGTDKRQLTFK